MDHLVPKVCTLNLPGIYNKINCRTLIAKDCLLLHQRLSSHCSGDGKVPVQYNQVRNWFQNRSTRMMMMPPVAEEHHPVAEVLVRFTWLGPEEDEWVDVQKCVRLRSLQCVAVLPGDLILCSNEGKEQAQYFDAHVLQVQRRTHDVRGCRCRFLVCYDHDRSEEFVPLSKVCRRPETDHMHQISEKPHKIMDVNTDKVTRGGVPIPPDQGEASDKPVVPLLDAPTSTRSNSMAHVEMEDPEAAPNDEAANEAHGNKMNVGVSFFRSPVRFLVNFLVKKMFAQKLPIEEGCFPDSNDLMERL
ncbi:uncharacterized protein [Triticum aestivum]|uniref:uncharacterized protein n=1 Tax=Triticum aestivum TaxID=4565 RepID=UPI001D026CF2|nr:uncharacterized protein LOC123071354 [Triticum aestivum]